MLFKMTNFVSDILLVPMFILNYMSTCTGDKLNDCVPIHACPSIFDLVYYTEKPLPKKLSNKLKEITCGFDETGSWPYIICPETKVPSKISINTEIPTTHKTVVSTVSKPVTEEDATLGSRGDHVDLLPQRTCGISAGLRVSHGNKTRIGQYPWMTLLGYQVKDKVKFLCGGTLINKRYVLSAAHCVTNLISERLISVRLGEHNVKTEEDCEFFNNEKICAPPVQDIPIESAIPHPAFTNLKNDIALIRLMMDAVLSDYVMPICLPLTKEIQNRDFTVDENRDLIVAGWGRTEKDYEPSDELLEIIIPFATIDKCETAFHRTFSDMLMCAGGEIGVDNCKGDSGGPIFTLVHLYGRRYVQYGIVMAGILECSLRTMTPGLYTKVAPFIPWILDEIY